MHSFVLFLLAVVLLLLVLPVALGIFAGAFYLSIFVFLIGALALWLTNRKP